jgi:hypothetical protein
VEVTSLARGAAQRRLEARRVVHRVRDAVLHRPLRERAHGLVEATDARRLAAEVTKRAAQRELKLGRAQQTHLRSEIAAEREVRARTEDGVGVGADARAAVAVDQQSHHAV